MQSLAHPSLISDYSCAIENFAWADQYANSTIFDQSKHFQRIVSDITNILYNVLYDSRSGSPLIQLLVFENKKQETCSTTVDNIKNATPFEKLILLHTFRKVSHIPGFSVQDIKMATLLLGINRIHAMNLAIQSEVTQIHLGRLALTKGAILHELNSDDLEIGKSALLALDDALEVLEKRIEELENLQSAL